MHICCTLQEHRCRGLGKALLSRHLSSWLQHGFGCAPYAYISLNDIHNHTHNHTNAGGGDGGSEAVRRLFSSLGFHKATDQYWLRYKVYGLTLDA